MYDTFVLQRKPKLGRTKPSTGTHAGRGLDITVIDQLLIWYAVDPQL